MKNRFCALARSYCRQNPIPCSALAVVALLWLCTPLILMIGNSAPIEYLPGTVAAPAVVQQGGEVQITRVYNVHRADSILITRHMEQGDCAKLCERIDLASTRLVTRVGTNQTSRRALQLPRRATPGIWTIHFTVTWENFMGKRLSIDAPPVQIEVTDK